jgi:dGTP triphosphohydrolase
MGVIIAQRIERQGNGLNLSYETLQGILHHSRGKKASKVDPTLPLEFSIVTLADKIAYTLSDINDALFRYEYIRPEDLPETVAKFGNYQRERELTCIKALVRESAEAGRISFSKSETAVEFEALKQWMFDNVYLRVDWSLQKNVLEKIYNFFSTAPEFKACDPAILVALLTDREANALATIFHETRKLKFEHLLDFGMLEILPFIKEKSFDFTDPDMDW